MDPLSVLAIIQGIVAAGGTIADLVIKLRERFSQAGELTPEQEKAFDDYIAVLMSSPHWQPTPPTPVPPPTP